MPVVLGVVLALLGAGGAASWYSGSTAEVPAAAAEPSTAPTAELPTPGPGPTTSVVPADPGSALAAQVEADRARAEQSVGYWLPQISAKAVGMEVDGTVYDAGRILAEFNEAQRRHDAFVVRSDDYSTFQRAGYLVVLVPQPFTDPRAANSWCVTNGFTPDGCFAKRLSHTAPPEGNTLHWRP